ncbi:putative phosphatase [Gordonia hirsuta DSM 44140 = NBRC 16056]|uniref:3'(2'),5-bisphosphonucleoside 3'(2')-phosphohydrolase n=2 Tax=Gordonia hirsuta DSM 44140 = NBRC 16056 TaxID=1121927 RepID=L7LBW5_9ACTN|nr:3'(2'),5'-bisphosphate nucleotidase CysQ [Gordonia hirsuta]GAC57508.1 putative phosphatase [Gordonia hirsuta DSM 44140 = NBRC 16056]
MTAPGRHTDAELAALIAEGAGQVLLGVAHGELLEPRRRGDVGDALAQAWIAQVLQMHRPQDPVLSEEADDDLRRLRSDRVWIIDPLDGTSEFARGTTHWAVHVALAVDGLPTASAVALPAQGQLFRSDEVPVADGPLTGRMAVSRYGHSYPSAAVADRLGLGAVHIGSAGAKAMAVVRGDVDAYVHAGGQYEWDNCAPVGVAQAAGLFCARLNGEQIVYNNPQPYMPDFVICRQEIADDLLRALRTPW